MINPPKSLPVCVKRQNKTFEQQHQKPFLICRILEEHNRLRNTIATAPVDALDREGRSLLQRMRLGPSHGDTSNESGGGGGGGSHGSWLSGGADFQSVAPKVSSLLERLQVARTHLLQSWSDRKLHLDQALQLHLYEQDATKVSWTRLDLLPSGWLASRPQITLRPILSPTDVRVDRPQ